MERGAILEKMISSAEEFSNEEVKELLQIAFQNEQVQKKIKEKKQG